MKHHPDIAPKAYTQMLKLVNNLFFTELKGKYIDFQFYHNDLWLSDTVVIEHISHKRGEWEIELFFVDPINPKKFLARKIASYSCPKKAKLWAQLMRRQAAKDQRGVIKVDEKGFTVCLN